MQLVVTPYRVCVSELIEISGSGFEASSQLTIHATLVCDSERLDLHSCCHITCLKDGTFNLTSTQSTGGSYVGVDGMGLFWAMVKRQENSFEYIVMTNGLTELQYKFGIYKGHVDCFDDRTELLSATCVRYYGDKHKITREELTEKAGNIRGTLFCPKSKGFFPGILIMYGDIKRKHVIEDAAALLANQGFVTLALAYFGVPTFPKTYVSQPVRVEYFEEAIDYLRNCFKVKDNNIGVLGSSKGGDIGFAMMSHLTKPKSYCSFNGSIASIGTSTTYRDKVTPLLSYEIDRLSSYCDGVYNIKNLGNDPREHPESVHKFENSPADLLMIVGLDDWNWKSEQMSDIAEERMNFSGKKNFRISKYKDMGHPLIAPFVPGYHMAAHVLFQPGKVYFGGLKNQKGHIYDLARAWKEMFDFFNGTLKQGNYYFMLQSSL